MQSTKNNSISKTILAIITIFFITAILAEPSLLIGYRTTAQVHNGGNIQSASHNPPPFEILGISPLTKPPVSAIRLDPPKLSIIADSGSNIADNTVQVAAPGTWLATTKTSWLEIHCATGNCGGSFLIVKFRIDGLKPGNYNGEVKIATDDDSVILPISLKIAAMANLKSVLIQGDTPPKPAPKPVLNGAFIQQNPNNPHRFVLDGKPFYPIGISDCVGYKGVSVLTNWGFDGRTRPPAGHEGDTTDIDTYLKAYRDAGFNLFRWSVGNCSFNLDSEHNWSEGDLLVGKLKQYGFRIQLVFFNTNSDGSANGLAYVKKVIDRYGRQVDIWEVSNESTDADGALIAIANYIKANDPNRHPVTTSLTYANPPNVRDFTAMDVTSPHFYTFAGEFDIDKEMSDNIIYWKRFGKPVIIGEYGNQLVNWDATSDLRNRLSTWSAFFAEGAIIFWNSSFIKNYSKPGSSNSYLGEVTRSFIKVLTDFTKEVPSDARIARIEVNKPNLVRASALSSSVAYFAYLHAFTNHQSQTSGISLTIEPQFAGTATWIEPATGRVLATGKVSAGRQTLTVPPFLIDAALKVSSSPSAKK